MQIRATPRDRTNEETFGDNSRNDCSNSEKKKRIIVEKTQDI